MKKHSLTSLNKLKQAGEKIAVLTAYDASFSRLFDEAGVDVLLVGDSLGMVVQGQETTVPVTMEDMVYHTRMVARADTRAFVVADMPFMSYATVDQALASATKLMQAGAQMVKLEGGAFLFETVCTLTERGIPVCGHIGLTPQSVHALGGYKIQGRDADAAKALFAAAEGLQAAGASLLVLECVPRGLAADISSALSIPTIGIGAGADCDGQVLVSYDMLGLTQGKEFRFVRNFMTGGSIEDAAAAYVAAVKNKSFPTQDESFE